VLRQLYWRENQGRLSAGSDLKEPSSGRCSQSTSSFFFLFSFFLFICSHSSFLPFFFLFSSYSRTTSKRKNAAGWTLPTSWINPGGVFPNTLASSTRSTSAPPTTTPTSKVPSFQTSMSTTKKTKKNNKKKKEPQAHQTIFDCTFFCFGKYNRQSFVAGWAKLQEVLVTVDEQAGKMMNEFQLDHLKDILVTKDDKQVQTAPSSSVLFFCCCCFLPGF